jgi:hypothetical protein
MVPPTLRNLAISIHRRHGATNIARNPPHRTVSRRALPLLV